MKRNVMLWVAQGALALLFIFAGGAKLVMSLAEMQQGAVVLPGWFLRGLGVCEILGALGLVLPGLTGIRPGLTQVAAACLSVVMAGAVAITAYGMGIVPSLFPLVVGLLLVTVIAARDQRVRMHRVSA